MGSSEAMTATAMSDFSGTSTISRSLQNSKALWSLSPLSAPDKLRPSQNLDALATDLVNTGFYDVGWDNNKGRLQVCSSPSSPVQLYQTNTASIDAFMNPKLHSSRRLLRPRTQSTLTFSSKPRAEISRPATARSVDMGEIGSGALSMQRPATSGGSARFSRLAQSQESVNALKGPIPGLAHSNLKALADVASTQSVSLGGVDVRPGAPSRGGAAGARPETPQIRPGSSGQGRPGTPSREEERPSTASVVNLNGTADEGFDCTNNLSGRETKLRMRPISVNVNSMRSNRSHPMQSFRPNRSHSFLVFSHMDKDMNGRITRSQMEGFCLSIGLSLEQCNKFFEKLDKSGKGYINVGDWGKPEVIKATEQFSLLYLQKFMGLPDISHTDEQVKKYWYGQSLKEAKNLPAAINSVRINTTTRGSHAAMSSGNVVYDAFSFMDTDGSGELDKQEVKDGFNALGVKINDTIADQIFQLFDKDNSGTVGYHEFLGALFPNRRL